MMKIGWPISKLRQTTNPFWDTVLVAALHSVPYVHAGHVWLINNRTVTEIFKIPSEIWAPSPKFGGPLQKMVAKFWQFGILIVTISRMQAYIVKWKTALQTAILSCACIPNLVNFGLNSTNGSAGARELEARGPRASERPFHWGPCCIWRASPIQLWGPVIFKRK